MKTKHLLAAGIVRDLEFRNKEAFEVYLHSLDHQKKLYKVLDTYTRDDGSMIVRIVQQYNDSELINLYQEDRHV